MIDEELLLNDGISKQPVVKSDCSSKPRACANCNCGRKELEESMD